MNNVKKNLLRASMLVLISLAINSLAISQSATFTSSLTANKNCGGAQVNFTMDDETGVLDYEWDFGNGQALVGGPYAGAGSTNASTTYIGSGQYTAQLTINKGLASEDIETLVINIYDAPSPEFEAINNTSQGCLNPDFEVEFDYTASTTDIVEWVYNFGDDTGDMTYTSALGSNGDVTHTYDAVGTYNVFLTVTDVNGCSQFLFQPGIVTISSTPVADFSVGALSSGDLPISVSFNDASTDEEDAIAFYTWKVEKQSDPGVAVATSSDQNATIKFEEYGDYNVILTVGTSPGECTKEVTKPFSLNENTVGFTPAASQEVCIGTDITFTNTSIDGNSGAMSYLWDFGDGQTSTDQNPTHSYSTTVGSPFEVSLTVDFSDGNQKTFIQSNFITVHEAFGPSFSADQQESCEAFTANFSALAGAVLYEWDFDYDGSTPNFTQSTASNIVSHNFSTDGDYDILLQVTSASGCVEQIIENDFIQISAPNPSFTIGVGEEEGCVGEVVNFNAAASANLYPSGNNSIVSYHWDFDNDGNEDATGASVAHNYASEGTYSPTLRIVTAAGCEATITENDYIRRGLLPTAGFNITQADLCIGTEIDFVSTSIPNAGSALVIDYIEWDFDDETTLTGDPSMAAGLNTPSHTYIDDTEDDATSYSVALKVSSNGCEATTNQSLDINYPVARFSVTGDDFNCLNNSQQTTFNAVDSEGVEEYRWEFGDGSVEPASGYTTGSDPSTTHEYSTSGDFTATLYVKNNTNSCEHTATQEINVSIGTVGFSSDVVELCYTSETVTFTNNSTTNTSGTTTYEWNFGAGASPATYTGANPPAVSYTSSGLKTVALTQTESHGCVRTITRTDLIEAKGPTANFSFTSTNSNDAIQCLEPSESVTFTNTSTVFGTGISADTWLWDFGAGASPATSNLQDPSGTPVTYSTSGQKTISLTVTDNEGCAHTVTKNTSISVPNPLAAFETDASAYCIITDSSNKDVSITNNSSESVLNSNSTWSWDFGIDASPATSSLQNPGAIGYTSTGAKTISLTVTTTDGCTSSTTRDITVYEANASFTVADATLDCAPQLATFTDTSNDIVAWEWDFGDQFGSTSSQQHPKHMYVLPGVYEVTLTTTSAGGCQQASSAQTVTVDGPYYTTYDFTPNNGCIEDDPQVDYDITGLVKVDQLQLDWGDGATAFSEDNMIVDVETSVSTNHIYNHNGDIGTFRPILTLTDDPTQVGACGSYIFPAPDKVIISSEPIPSFSSEAIVGNGCQNVEIQFTDETQLNDGLTDPRYPLKTWTWDFGDGSPVSNDKNPRHIFATDGTFNVTLTVATEFGCEASVSANVLVRPSILDATSANSQTVCSGEAPATLDAAIPTGGTGSYAYLWETSTNQTDWLDASGTNNLEDYVPAATSPADKTTEYYRRVTTSGPCDFTSDNFVITTDVVTDGGTLSTNATECYGENQAILVLAGETGDIQKWQSSTTNAFSGEEIDIANTSHTLTYTDLTETTYYRAVVKNGVCSIDNSSVATITVLPDFTGNVIDADIVSCIDAAASTITATAPGGSNGNFTFQWQDSPDNVTFADIGGATAATYSPGVLTEDTWYRRRVISDGNCETTSGAMKIEVSPLAIAGDDQTTSNLSITMDADASGFRPADAGTWTVKSKPAAASPNIVAPTSATSTIDNLIPGDYTFTWTVDNGTCTMSDDVDVTIQPLIQVSVSPASVDEDGSTDLVYTFTSNGAISSALVINFGVSGTATYSSDVGSDDATSFGNTSGTATLPANNTTVAINVTPNDDTNIEGDETLILTVVSGTGYDIDTPNTATGTIADDDDDDVVLVLTKGRDAEEEGEVSLQYIITLHDTNASGAVLTNETGSNISCSITYTAGTASATSDFSNLNTQTVNVSDGSSFRNRFKTVIDDDAIELTETLSAQLSGASGPVGVAVSVDATSVQANVIDNDDDKANLVITKLNDGVEGGQDIEFQVKLTDGASTDLTNETGSPFTGTLAFSNTADINDMTEGAFPTTFSIANNTGSTNYTYDPIYDTEVEIESLTATISLPVANNGITPVIDIASATASIDDNAELEISTTQNGVEETPANTNVQYTVKLTGPNPADAGATTVDYTNESGGNITAGLTYSETAVAADLTTALPGTVTIANASGSTLVDLVVNDDLLVEGDEILNAELGTPTTGVSKSATKGDADATISDNDDEAVVLVTLEKTQDGAEGGDDVVFTVKLVDASDNDLTNATGSPITVDIAFATGSSAVQDDFNTTYSSLSPVSIANNSGSTTVTLEVEDDFLIEEDEMVRATISNPTGAALDAVVTADADVVDNDDDNVHIKITAIQDGIEDGNGTTANNVKFEIELTDTNDRSGNTLTNATGTAFTGSIGYSGADGSDFDNTLDATFSIANNESTVELDFDAKEDANVEIETLTVTISGENHASVPVSIVVNSDDAEIDDGAVLEIVKTQDGAEQGTVSIIYTVQLTDGAGTDYFNTSGAAITADVDFSGSAAAADITGGLGTVAVSIPNGGDHDQTVTLSVIDDLLLESDETVTATISNPSSGVTITPTVGLQSAEADLIDNDVANAGLSVTQHGNETGPVSIIYTVTLDKDNNTGTAITVEIDDDLTGTATSGNDYTAIGAAATVSIADGDNTGTLTVTVANDGLLEADLETVDATISNPSNSDVTITAPSATANITDNEEANAVLSVTQHGNEAGPVNIIYTVTLSKENNTGSTIDFDIDDDLSGTATSGDDYTAIAGAATVSVANGETTGTLTITVTNDALLEADIETVDATISNPSNADINITTASATANITDNEEADAALSVTQHGNETGPVNIIYTVTLSKENNTGSAITFDIDDDMSGTAVSGTDYTAIAGAAIISVADGETTGTLTVSVTNDALLEANIETVDATISNPSNADITITTPSATANITDNDLADAVLSVTQHGNENGPVNIIYTVALSKANNTGTAITFDIDDDLSGTATSGDDYTAIAGAATVSIADGETTGTLTVVVIDDSILEVDVQTVDATISNPSNPDVTITTPSATANITDDETANAVLSVTQHGNETGPVNIIYTVTLSRENNTGTTITFDIDDDATGTATSGVDYTAIADAAIISIADGETTGTLTVNVTNDTPLEADTETVDATISNASNGDITITTPSASANITDNDSAEVTITSDSQSEGTDLTFTLELDNDVEGNVVIDVSFLNVTSEDEDYTEATQTFTFASGAKGTKTVTVGTTDDNFLEIDETFTAELSLGTGNVNNKVIVTSTGTGTIEDNDPVNANLTVKTHGTEAGPQDIVYLVTLTKENQTGSAITFDIDDLETGSATKGSDYTAVLANAEISVADNSSTGEFTVAVLDDAIDEVDNETVDAQISNPSNGDVTIVADEATANITDDEGLPTVTLAVNNATIAENGGIATFTVTSSDVSGLPITIALAYSGDADGSGTDYTSAAGTNANSAIEVVIPAGSTQGTVTVTADNDVIDENDETVTVEITSVTNGSEDGTQSATTTITDDDDAPAISLSVDNPTIAENGGVATFTVTADAVSGLPITVDLGYGGDATGSGTDYSAAAGTNATSAIQVVIPAGSTQGTVTVTADDDAIDENAEDVTVEITSVTNGSEDGTQTATTTITDDDAPPSVSIAVNNAIIAEIGGVATFTVTSDAVSGLPVTVTLGYSGDAIGSGVDYTAAAGTNANSATEIVIPPGSTQGTITVASDNDVINENDETVVVEITAVTNGTEDGTQSAITTITEDDVPPTIGFSMTSSSGLESVSNAALPVDLNTVSGLDVSVDYTVTGTATGGGTDYTLANGTFSITAGDVTGNISIASIVDDLLNENSETVIVTLSNPVNASLSANTIHTYTITDNDAQPTVQFNTTTSEGLESVSEADLQVDLSAVSGLNVSVDYTISGTADGAGVDYTLTSGTLVISAGDGNDIITIEDVIEDLLDEVNETVIVTLSNPVNATLGTNTVHTYTIIDNEELPTVAFEIIASSNEESVATAVLKVDLSGLSSRDVTVDYTLSGTAEGAGIDHGLTNGTLTIAAGSSTNNITIISIVNDDITEIDETVIVTLNNPTNATVGQNDVHTYTILDDDNVPPEAEGTSIEVKDFYEGDLTPLVSDDDGDPLTFTPVAIEDPQFGEVVINEDGTFMYTPDVGYIGEDSFVYEVCDNATPIACATATVTITVLEGEKEAVVLNTVISSTSPYPYDRLQIEDIENFPDNTVKVFNRWGNMVWEIRGYDNRENAFSGTGNGGGVFGSSGKLPVGTYFYVIDLGRGRAPLKGFVRVQ